MYVAATIGELQHSEYLQPLYVDIGSKTDFVIITRSHYFCVQQNLYHYTVISPNTVYYYTSIMLRHLLCSAGLYLHYEGLTHCSLRG